MDKQEKIEILRQHETYSYQICHYMLRNEQLSSQAAEMVLLQIAADAQFFTDSDETRRKKVKRLSIRSSLLWLTETKSTELRIF